MPALMGPPKGVKRYVTGQERERQKAYRQTDAGRMARAMYLQNPETQARTSALRKIKKHMKGL